MGIICQICNREFKSIITFTHLKTHNVTTFDYVKLYGEDSLSTPESRKQKSEFFLSDKHPMRGKKQTAEQRLAHSERMRGSNNPNFGKECTDDRRKNISLAKTGKPVYALRGRKRSAETIEKIKHTKKRQYESGEVVHPNKGVPRSEETRKKISKSTMGRIPPNKGVPMSEKQRIDLSVIKINQYKNGEIEHWNIGNETPAHTRQKITTSVKLYADTHKDELVERGKRSAQTRKNRGYHNPNFNFKGKEHTPESLDQMKLSQASKRDKSHALIIERVSLANLSILSSLDVGFSEGVDLLCNVCNNSFKFSKQYLTKTKFKKELCPTCYPRAINRSKMEIEIYNFVKDLYPDAIPNYRNFGASIEVDVFISSLKLAIEYNGLYWHSENVLEYSNKSKLSDYNKLVFLDKQGIRLITIFEDEWVNKKHLVKERLLNILGKTGTKIYARKCVVKEIDSKTASIFCETYHIQGKGRSNIRFGLYFEDLLVSVMTISTNNISRRIKDTYEINRFCSVSGVVVVGGANKLFSAFIKMYNPVTVISYADRRWSNGNLYKVLGFTLSHNTKPNYWYVQSNDIHRIHRFTLRKQNTEDTSKTEFQLRDEQGYSRIWDCGSSKWVWHNPNL